MGDSGKTQESNKTYKKLNKKEKSDLEEKTKQMFQDFTSEYDEKAQNLMYQVMPRMINNLNVAFNNFEKINLSREDILEGLPKAVFKPKEEPDAGLVGAETEDVPSNGGKRKRDSEKSGLKKAAVRNLKVYEQMLLRLQNPVRCNKRINEVIAQLKKECLFFIKMVGTLKLWIQLNIPKIEDGNNFGVTVQEEIVTELASKENHAFNIMEEMMKYFTERARICKKILKYPLFEDFQNALVEHDDRAFIMFRMDFLDMRNYYLTLLDVIKKNYEKIKKPRGNGSYRAMF